jgi:hypothetical protein
VFQGFTLIAVLTYTKNFKKLFSWQHIACGLVSVLIIGSYFYNYYQFNPNLEGYFSTIWDQSSKRTAAEFGLDQSLIHMVQFPFEHIGHLFPASLLILFCFHKGFIHGVKQNPFLTFISVVFLANIWVYWLSPITRPRYLMMLYPLLFILWSHAYYTYREQLPVISKLVDRILLILALAVCLGIPAAYFFELQSFVTYQNTKIVFLLLISIGITFMIWRLKTSKIIPFILLLVVVRLAFSWFILPHRLEHMEDKFFREAAVEVGTITRGQALYFYQYHPAETDIPFHDKLIFYLQKTRMKQVKFTEDDVKLGYYFTFDRDLKNRDALVIKSYKNLKLFQIK